MWHLSHFQFQKMCLIYALMIQRQSKLTDYFKGISFKSRYELEFHV